MTRLAETRHADIGLTFNFASASEAMEKYSVERVRVSGAEALL
jgi:hypothetical protein